MEKVLGIRLIHREGSVLSRLKLIYEGLEKIAMKSNEVMKKNGA